MLLLKLLFWKDGIGCRLHFLVGGNHNLAETAAF